MRDTGLHIENYKSFGASGASIPNLTGLVLIVGRNNSGKSSLLDAVEIACNPRPIESRHGHGKGQPKISIAGFLTKDEVIASISPTIFTSSGIRPYEYYGPELIGSPASLAIAGLNSTERSLTSSKPDIIQRMQDNNLHHLFFEIAGHIENPLQGKRFRKLSAERDVKPEQPLELRILPDGTGVTGTLASIINKIEFDRDIIQVDMLDHINSILVPDTEFAEISAQLNENGLWEILLENYTHGLVRLSDSGSGIKTVIATVAMIELYPFIEKGRTSDYVFAFEELENNLHPAVQRRLVDYILKSSRKHGFLAILTTHSSAVIDFVSQQEDASIIHVSHNGVEASATYVKSLHDSHALVDDLGVRASDLLQSNCIIWMEGPSDRVYLNKWIDLFSDGDLKEGLHYQCLYYGGKILSHFSFDKSADNSHELVDAIRINRNSIVIIDSDKRTAKSLMNETKRRVVEEIEKSGGVSWVTAGREVENYIPKSALDAYTGKVGADLDRYSDIKDYFEGISKDGGARFERSKVMFARDIIEHITKQNISERYDLNVKIGEVISYIKACNGI